MDVRAHTAMRLLPAYLLLALSNSAAFLCAQKPVADFVITFVHAPAAGVTCARGDAAKCFDDDHWQVQLRPVEETASTDKRVVCTMKQLEKELRKVAAKKTDPSGLSEVSIAVRVEPKAPYGIVKQMVELAAKCRIYKVEIETVPTLATSSQGTPVAAADVALILDHAPKAGVTCAQMFDTGRCTEPDHWQIQLVAGDAAATVKPLACSMSQLDEIAKELKKATAAKSKETEHGPVSEASVSLRVPPQTPYGFVRKVLESAATCGIHRIEFAVVPAGTAGEERRLATPLPVDQEHALGEPGPEIRIAVFKDRDTGGLVRVMGRRKIPDGAPGDALMASFFEAAAKGKDIKSLSGIVDSAADVRWQMVVGIVDAFRAAGYENIQFASSDARK
jgi:biopolymer transport protein ExbD